MSLLGIFKGKELVVEELNKYISIVLQVKHSENDHVYYQRSKFRNCRLQDFENRQFAVLETKIEHYERRLCPDLDDYKVQNLRNMDNYVSFSINIEKCTKNCNLFDNSMFDDIMSKVYFTLYYLQESAELNNYDLGSRPTVV